MQCTWRIYVDASCDERRCGLGGVSMAGDKAVGYFKTSASDDLLKRMNPYSDNPIFEFECLALLGSFKAWGPILRGCNIVAGSDNEGALSCIIRGASDNLCGAAIVQETRDLTDRLGCDGNVWFERVNNASNIADQSLREFLVKGLVPKWM